MKLGWRGLFARLQLLAILAGFLAALAWLTTPEFAALCFAAILSFCLVMVITWHYIDVMIRWWDR